MVSATNGADLERALQRYGDDVYRLALVFGRDERTAERILLAMVRRLALADQTDESMLVQALLTVLPSKPERALRRLPRWAVPPSSQAAQAPLLAAIARLPGPARVALGLAYVRAFEPRQIATLLGTGEDGVREQLRDALLALAAHAPIERTELLTDPEPPEACRLTRAALALADPARLAAPAVRGHLALCSACRAADLAWSQLHTAVEETLRGALRDVRLPAALDASLHAAARTPSDGERMAWLARPRVRIALVTLPVVLLILFLVWPRSTVPTPGGSTALQSAADPRALVARAAEQLYAPPANATGVWHAQYDIQWFFTDGLAVQLNAEQWEDTAGGRHRLQLVHHTGGGPYEFELADGTDSIWYAVSENYANSLFPFSAIPSVLRGRFTASASQRADMRDMRLHSGPWALPRRYLSQATNAELRTWGRQRDADGRLLQLVSFAGISPLALPPDAPDATSSHVTILLTIDETSGQLREVRELFGAAGTEQSARTTWRLVNEETMSQAEPANRAFDVRSAWNGVGTFVDRGALGNARLPLVDANALVAPADLVQSIGGIEMPQTLPPGTQAIALVNNTPADFAQIGYMSGVLTLGYFGVEHQLFLNTRNDGTQLFTPNGNDELTVGDVYIHLQALPGQGYRALVTQPSFPENIVTQVVALGYTRAELLAVLQSLGPPSTAALAEQAPLFIEARPHDAAWLALVGALADPPAPPAGSVRHFVEHVFKRQLHQPDPLTDPYHRPPYGGWPEQLVQENWVRDTANGQRISGSLTRDQAGRLLARQYRSPGDQWDYDALASRVVQYTFGNAIHWVLPNEDQSTVLRALGCPGAMLQTSATGVRSITIAENGWREHSCAQSQYVNLLREQRAGILTDSAPFLADLDADTLTTVITLGADGRATRTEVWAGLPAAGTLLESWERVHEDTVPVAKLSADAISEQPPAATLISHYNDSTSTDANSTGTHSATLTDTLSLVRSPLIGFAPGSRQAALMSLDVGSPPGHIQSVFKFTNTPNSVFDSMLREGYAIRAVYSVRTINGFQQLRLFQGPVAETAAYLRAHDAWLRSERQQLAIGNRTVEAWTVTERDTQRDWLMFELDGTLLAVQSPGPELLPILKQLVPLK